MGSQVSGKDRTRLPGRGAVGEVRRGRIASDRAKERVYRFMVRFGRERRASAWHASAFGDDRRSTSGSGDVSLTIFITSVNGSESLSLSLTASSTLGGLRLAFDAAEKNGRFSRIQCQRSKDSSSRGKRRVFLCGRTVGVKNAVIPASFPKIEGRETLVESKEGWLVELVGDQNPGPEVR